jgi:hypothetical protein
MEPARVFIALEAHGYLMMSGALPSMAPAFNGDNVVERSLRWVFVGTFVVAVAALVGWSAAYGHDLEYRFEVAVIAIDFTALIAGGALLSVHIGRLLRVANRS